jgi:Zn-dependent M28 family amino/carboxypeptidase
MRSKAFLACVAAVSLSAPAFGQSPSPAAPLPAFSADAFHAHVAFLADDLLEGREAGTRGYDIAARYVATQFEALGLSPAGPDGAWQQPVEFVSYAQSSPATLTIGTRTFTNGEGILFTPSAAAEPVAVDAPLVFVGRGLDLPAQGMDDYAGLDVAGKIVVAMTGVPNGTRSDVAAHLRFDRRRMAARRGAVGLIEIRPPSARRAERSPAAAAAAAARPEVTWLERGGSPHSDTPGLRFIAAAEAGLAQALFEGARRPLASLFRDAAAGRPLRGFALGRSARVAQTSRITHFSSSNVVAMLPGSDPSVAGEYVLLMAHLDGLGIRAPRDDDAAGADRIRNGAMDNATGVATLIEVARQMVRDGRRQRRPVLFAAVTAEEKGLLGAGFLAMNPVVDGRVISVVNLDMPILTYDFQDVIAFGAEHSTMGPIVARAAARMGVAVAPDPLPEQSLFVRSDHYQFVRVGVPSVFLMTGFGGEGRERFTGFLGDQYHSPRDDLSLPFNWQTGARFAQLNYLISREIADGPEAPRWYQDSFFADAVGGDRPRAIRPPEERQQALSPR